MRVEVCNCTPGLNDETRQILHHTLQFQAEEPDLEHAQPPISGHFWLSDAQQSCAVVIDKGF